MYTSIQLYIHVWWTQPTFPNRGTAYNSRSFAGNLLFVGAWLWQHAVIPTSDEIFHDEIYLQEIYLQGWSKFSRCRSGTSASVQLRYCVEWCYCILGYDKVGEIVIRFTQPDYRKSKFGFHCATKQNDLYSLLHDEARILIFDDPYCTVRGKRMIMSPSDLWH